MAIKKSELYNSLWKSCDELRGGMDASQYKDYVLVPLFVKYVLDKSKTYNNFLIDVPNSGSFSDMDTDIQILERKRDKYKEIKISMMQQLLTGKTRLIKEN